MARVTRTDIKMREIMNSSRTPDFSSLHHLQENFSGRYGLALNWIHRMVESDQLRTELEQLLRNTNRESSIALLDTISAPVLSTMGKIAYCINRGAVLSERSMAYITRALTEPAPVMGLVAQVEETASFEHQAVTPAGRVNQQYVACYSRLDNLKNRVLHNLVNIKDVAREVRAIVEAHGGRAAVGKRLVEHYTQSVSEAQNDVSIRNWLRPLREILRALGGVPSKEITVKPQAKPQVKASTKTPRVTQQTKNVKVSVGKQVKPAVVANTKPSKAGGVSFASQVREMISQASHKGLSRADVIAWAVNTLGMKQSSARNCVLGYWDRVSG
jgi:hypothetical protein